jgi:hypothetical protein
MAAFLSMATPYIISKKDMELHRPAPAVKALEVRAGLPGWESQFKPQVKMGGWLVFYDIVLVLFTFTPPAIYSFYRAASTFTKKRLIVYAPVTVCMIIYTLGWIQMFIMLGQLGKLMDSVA